MLAQTKFSFIEGDIFDPNHKLYHFIEDILLEDPKKSKYKYPRVKKDTIVMIRIIQVDMGKKISKMPHWMVQKKEEKIEVYS